MLSNVPSLSQIMALQCPRCRRNNLIQSNHLDIYYLCPDPQCGYVIWSRPPITLNTSQKTK